MDDWANASKDAIATGKPAALVSILATEGSAPRGAGTRMLVKADDTSGTIGGGALEHQVIAQARAILGHPVGTWRVQDYPLGPLLGQCCGGRVRLLVEHVDPAASGWIGEEGIVSTRFSENGLVRTLLEPKHEVPLLPARGDKPEAGAQIIERLGQTLLPVMLFGAGHVGRAVSRAVEGLPVSLAWLDSRETEARWPGVALIEQDRLVDCVADAPADAAILIMTHDHGLDYDLTKTALASPARFVGLIGSATKRARFVSRLGKEGVDISGLTCPIGVAGITGKEPAIIAIAVAAQLMQLHGGAE